MKYVISAAAILLANGGVFALPQGGRIESGKGNLDNPAHIIQESQHLQTRWNSFDIAAKEQVRIQQPNAQASINIKVSAGGGTTINGTLTANGRVSLENPAGIQFGKNSVVNVGGLLASSAKGAVTSLGQVRATEVVRFQGLSSKSLVNVGGDVAAQEIIVESNGNIVIGNSAHFTASKQVLIGGGFQGKDSSVLNSRTTDVKAAAQINAPYVVVWSDKVTRFLGRIDAGRGFVEVSGKQYLIFPDINRAKAGTLLLDPYNLEIVATSQGSDSRIRFSGIIRADDTLGTSSNGTGRVSAPAIELYNGNVFLAATNNITVSAPINKSNGSLTLTASDFEINEAITISGAGNYLSFVLAGVGSGNPFVFGASGGITTDDLRIARNYAGQEQVAIPTNFAAPGRTVTITGVHADNGRIGFGGGFNLCPADNTGCGDLIIDAGRIFFTNRTNNTIRAKSITITMHAVKGLVSNFAPAEFHAHEGEISLTANNSASVFSEQSRDFSFSATTDISFSNVVVDIGTGAMTLTAGVGDPSTGIITLTGSAFTTLSKLTLEQDGAFFTTAPYSSKGSASVEAIYGGAGVNPPITWATTLTSLNATPNDLNVSDGNLSAALDGKFDASSGTLDLGSSNLTAHTKPLVVPSHITTITTMGTISIASGLSRTTALTLTADTIVLGGTVAVGLENQLFLNSPNPITASSNLRIEAVIFVDAPSLGFADFDLWISSFLSSRAIELLGNDITINGTGIASNSLTITAKNDIILEGLVQVDTLVLEAKEGGVIFSTVVISGVSRMEITQADPYAATAPTSFPATPILSSPTLFVRPSWGSCGTNCFDSIVPAELFITDGDLATALVGKFDASSGTLDLGDLNLTANTKALVIPSHITIITTTGMISITDGLTTTAGAGLNLTADTFAFGGTLTAGTNTLTLNSANPITASSVLTVSSPLALSAPSLGSASFDLILAAILITSAVELRGKNITLGGAVTTPSNSALTVTADNDLAVNDAITATTLALIAAAGGITFASPSTLITASTIMLTQAAAYAAIAPATFSTTPILNSATPFVRPSWGICGTKCLDSAVPADLFITDGDLGVAIGGKFDASSGTLDLGNFNLTAHTKALDIPPSIHTITTMGTISIASGSTASAPLQFAAGTMVLGGTFTTGGNSFFLNSPNPITASSALTIEAAAFVLMPSLGSVDFDLTLADISTTGALTLLGKNITLNGDVTTLNNSALTVTAANDLAVNGAITAGTLALEAAAGGITFASTSAAITGSTINLTQAAAYAAIAPADFSTTPILNSPNFFNKPTAWGVCGTNCLVATDLVIIDGDLGVAIGGKFDVSSGTLDLGSFNLTANTAPLDIPPSIHTITTTGMISITDGLTTTAAAGVGLNLTADTFAFGGTLTAGTNTLTLNSANPITASSVLTVSSPLTLSAPSLGFVDFDLILAAISITSAVELRGKNITLGGAVTTPSNSALTVTADNDIAVNDAITVGALALIAAAGGITFASTSTAITASSIDLTQADPYVVIVPADFSTTPILNSATPFNRPSWGLCGTNCFDPTDLVITDGDLERALMGKFYLSSGTLDLGNFNLMASTAALDIPSHILSITTTGMISITDGLTATARAAGLSLTADTMMALGGIFTAGTNTLTLTSANPITASSALTVSSPLALAAPSLGFVDFDLILAAISITSAVELRGKNITLFSAVTVNSSALAITADNDIAVNDAITVGALALTAAAGGITFASTSTAITASSIDLTQADPYVVIVPATFSTTPVLNSATPFTRPFWGSCGMNCSDPAPTDLVIIDGDLGVAIGGKFDASSGTLDLGSFNLTANTVALDIPSHILSITTTGMISITDGLTATAAAAGAGLTLTAGTIGLGGILTTDTNTLTLNSANPITASSALTVSSPLALAAPSLGSVGFDLTLAGVTSLSALELRGSNIMFNGAVTAGTLALIAAGGITFASTSTAITGSTINLTQAAAYAAIAPADFSTTPILNSPNFFNKPTAWGVCGTNCLVATDLVIIDGDLGVAIGGKFDVSSGTLDLGSFNLTANTAPLDIPPSIHTITTTGMISIADGLTTTAGAGVGLNLTADTFAFGGTLTAGTNTLTLNSANPITASSVLTVSSPLTLSAPSLGFVDFDLILAAISITSAVELRGKNITLGGAVTTPSNSALTVTADNDIAVNDAITVGALALIAAAGGITFVSTSTAVAGSTIMLTQAAAYAAIAPATFSTTPILNSATPFVRPSWGICGTNCLDSAVPADLFITDGDLGVAIGGKFDVSSGTLDLGSFNLTANTAPLDIPPSIHTITTTGMISITDGLTATARAAGAALSLTAGTMMELGGIFTAGINTLTLNSANPITASSALTVSSPLALSAPSLGSASFDLILAAISITSAVELRGKNITLFGAVTTPSNSALTVTADNDLAVNDAITVGALALIAAAGGITFVSTSTAITASSIDLTQADPYVVIVPAIFSTTPILNSATPFTRPFWGSCGMNCSDPAPTDLVIIDGDLGVAIGGKFDASSGTLDLGSFNLTANTKALVIPSGITVIMTTGTISIADGLTATARAAGLTLTAGTIGLGGILTTGTDTLTLTSANPITASSALTVSSPLALAAPSLDSVSFDLTLAGVTSLSALELLGSNITFNGAVTAPTINLTQAAAYAAIAPTTFSTLPTLNRPTPFTRPSWGLCGTNCVDPENMLTSASVIQFFGNNIMLGSAATNSFALTLPAADDIAVNSANGWRPCSRGTSGQNYFCYH